MIESFKNFERLRYRLSNDMRELASQSAENSDSTKEQISGTVFATVFSGFITEMAFGDSSSGYNIHNIMKKIAIFIIVYIIAYIAYKLLNKLILVIWNIVKINSCEMGMDVMIQKQKDFDNIACDSILMAREYRDSYETIDDISENRNLRIFCYYEIMHYLDAACDKTLSILENKTECVRTSDKATGVDIFRIINLKNMMDELRGFLDSHLEDICNQNNQSDSIKYQYGRIKKKMEDIQDKL